MNANSPVDIDEQVVVDYLLSHPDFFQHHLDVLEKMHIPHPSGNAVSLIAKQLEVFRLKHKEQESQLAALIDIARDNDAAFNRMHELTLAMLESRDIEELAHNRPRCGRPTFPQACFLFGDAAPEVRSAAIIPMVFTEMEGLLAIGSRDESRFHYSMGSLFLTQMSEVVGTRLIALLAEQ